MMNLVMYENRPLCKILSLLPSFTFVGKSKLLMVLLHHIILKSLYEQLMEKNTLQDWTSTLFYKKQNRQNGNNAKRNTTSLYWQKHIRNDKLSWQNFITHFLFKLANGSWTWNIEGKLYIMYSIFCLLLRKTQLSANWAIN